MNVDVAEAPDQDGAPSAPGLRERSKAKRRAQIQRTAMSLFAERGFEATTVVEIADAAEVAPRTVSGYFPTKIDLATSFAEEVAGRLTSVFTEHPDADIYSVLGSWLAGEAEALDPQLTQLATAMYEANPQLGALSSARVSEAAQLGRAAIETETGLPPEHPMLDICQAALGAAMGAYLAASSHHGPTPELQASMMTFLRGLIGAATAEA